MKWKTGQKGSTFFAVCKVANDNGRKASKLNTEMQKIYSRNPIQCINSILKINGDIISGDYDFCIYGSTANGIEEAMKTAEEILKKL